MLTWSVRAAVEMSRFNAVFEFASCWDGQLPTGLVCSFLKRPIAAIS